MEVVGPKADVGVIVGRFQVHELHQGHRDLIEHVAARHSKLIIVLGLSKCRVTYNNPLDFESRAHMIREAYPDALVMYLDDSASDLVWSKKLDAIIAKNVSPHASVVLYGSRDAFIKHYHGKNDVIELEQVSYVSGTEIRKELSMKSKNTADFRAGVIYAAMNQFPKAVPTVDVAIWDSTRKEELLMARKPEEAKWRFVGGFCDGRGTFEDDARREVIEETQIEPGDFEYIGSHVVDDWRYRNEVDRIVTTFFQTWKLWGAPTPDDDIEELKWFRFDKLRDSDMVDEHKPLLKMLRCKRESENATA